MRKFGGDEVALLIAGDRSAGFQGHFEFSPAPLTGGRQLHVVPSGQGGDDEQISTVLVDHTGQVQPREFMAGVAYIDSYETAAESDVHRDVFGVGVLHGIGDQLAGCQFNRAAADSSHPSTVVGLLATVYQTSASLLLKLGDVGHAWMAVGRAMAEAERCGDPVVLASSVRVHAHVLARDKHTAQAVALVRHTAEQLTGAYDRRPPHYLAALGLMLLRGVTAASSAGDRAATQDFLREASDVARHVTLDRPEAWANFSPTNVELHAVSAAVALGDAGIALETARPLMRRPIPVPERRAAL